MTEHTDTEELRRQLRAGDPLPPGERLAAETAARMRRAMLIETPRPSLWRRWPQPVLATALAAVLAAALGSVYLLGSPPSTNLQPPDDFATTRDDRRSVSGDHTPDRQIQFITRGGTRVIWMLKPKTDDSTDTP